MYCKDCRWMSIEISYPGRKLCNNMNIHELLDNPPDDDLSDDLVYSYSEGGVFIVGDFFGCVHFDER